MKKYFEYPINAEIKEKIMAFYENTDSDMHTSQMERKATIKIQRILKSIEFEKEDIVLDVGCSRGEFLKLVHTKIKEGIGIDVSSNIICINQKENKYPNIRYEVFDGVQISLHNPVNKICLLDVLEHAFEPDALIESMYNNLGIGGVIIVEVPTTGWLSELVFGKYHMGHLRYYDPDSIKKFLQKHNFIVKSITTYNAVPAGVFLLKRGMRLYNIMDKICNKIPARLYPYYGAILVIAQKQF